MKGRLIKKREYIEIGTKFTNFIGEIRTVAFYTNDGEMGLCLLKKSILDLKPVPYIFFLNNLELKNYINSNHLKKIPS